MPLLAFAQYTLTDVFERGQETHAIHKMRAEAARSAPGAERIRSSVVGAHVLLREGATSPVDVSRDLGTAPLQGGHDVLRCPGCGLAIMSSSEGTVRPLLWCPIQTCGAPEEPEVEDGGD